MRGTKMCDVFSKPTRKKCHNIGSAKILESHQLYRRFLKSDRSFLNILNVITRHVFEYCDHYYSHDFSVDYYST